jgi:predicted nucleic acid-binding protein
LNLVDSSGWIEYFTAGPNVAEFRPILHDHGQLGTSAVSVYEVLRVLLRRLGEDQALVFAGAMRASRVIPVDGTIAQLAAHLSIEHRLAMADSIIYATARATGATLYTQDADFNGLPGTVVVPKRDP